ncbi:MAG: aldehyde ferredoxin oxidoreductase C-terminal domain-containing protein [Thermodesulfobacteriota bacterium]
MRGWSVDHHLYRVLIIDLSKHSYFVDERKEYFQQALGGVGAGIRLLREFLDPKVDPHHPDNPIIFSIGALTGKFPMISKMVSLFKSPHHGLLGESHAGGRSAIALWQAGYGALVIKGESPIPLYITVEGNKVHFRDARAIWGIADTATVGRLIREREGQSGFRTILRIGKAGEKGISYANVTTETYRHFGRLGLGAVFGSKKLKALVISGKRTVLPEDKKTYLKLYDEIYEQCTSSPTKKYHELGTSENILPLNALGALPTRNLKATTFEKAETLSGENLATHYLGRRIACSHCPVGCIHLAVLRERYPDDPYFFKTTFVSYDYEPLYSLGTLLGIDRVEDFLKLMIKVEKYGMDAITMGVVLAWVTEAFEKGLIGKDETEGFIPSFGDSQTYMKMVERMMESSSEFYQRMGRGVETLIERYGGEEFALSFFGNEISGYHTGAGSHLTHITGARHSHLDSAGYSLDQKIFKEGKPLSPKEMAQRLFEEEALRQVLTSLVICLFARNVYTLDRVKRCLNVFGWDFSEEDLLELGKKIVMEKNRLKREMGFDMESVRIPKRILETPSPFGPLNEFYLRETVHYFKELIDL